ncbi:MAG: SdpI family protein [Caulobacteraceae bacterium]|nr:MAG: SdpI family protein [Caulobacteraceae bacterium]
MTFKPTRMEAAAGVVVLAQLGLAVCTARFGSTGPVAMHFDITGAPDRWSDRIEAAGVILVIAAITAACAGAMAFSLRTSQPDAARRRGLTIGMGIILAATGAVALLPFILATPSFAPEQAGRMGGAFLCLILAIAGAVLGKVPPNALVGVRTPWSLNSRLSWDRSNRLAGRLFFWGGLIGLPVSLLLPPQVAMGGVTAAVLLIAVYVVVESWRVWRADPDRRAV